MRSEPRTTYYPTGFVRRVLRASEHPTKTLRLAIDTAPDDPDTLAERDVPTKLLAPAPQPVPSAVAPRFALQTGAHVRRELAWVALSLAIATAAFAAGQHTAVPTAARSSRVPAQAHAATHPLLSQPLARAKAQPRPSVHAPPAAHATTATSNEQPGSLSEAVDALARADYAQALERYALLSASRPHDEALKVIAGVLQRKLHTRCIQTLAAEGSPCTNR